MAEVVSQQETASVLDFVTDFDHTYTEFMTNWEALLSLAPFVADHPHLQKEYDYWINRGGADVRTLQNLKYTRDQAASWLDWFYKGAQGTWNWLGQQTGLQGLGIGPLVLIGIGSAIGALAAVMADLPGIIAFSQRSNLTMKLVDDARAGKIPYSDIPKIVDGTIPPSVSFLGSVQNMLTMIVIGAAVVFLGPPIIRALTGGRD